MKREIDDENEAQSGEYSEKTSPWGKKFIKKIWRRGRERELLEGVDTRGKLQGQNNSSTIEVAKVQVQVDMLVHRIY